MSIYAALKTELAKPEYSGLSDAEASAAINAKTVTTRATSLELKWVKFVLQLRFNTPNDPSSGSKWQKILDAAGNSNPIAATFKDFYTDLRFEALDLADANVAGMLYLARSQIPGITSEDIDAVLAKADETRPWLATFGMDRVTDGDIASAKASVI